MYKSCTVSFQFSVGVFQLYSKNNNNNNNNNNNKKTLNNNKKCWLIGWICERLWQAFEKGYGRLNP